MLTMIHTEKLFVPPIHQPIVAPSTVRVDDAVKGCLVPDCGLWRRSGRFPCRHFPVAFQNPEDNRFTPGPAPFLPTNTAPAERGIH